MIDILREGINIFRRNILVKFFGLKKYSGTDKQICGKIIYSCYNKKMNLTHISEGCFNASSGNYRVFYSRDFGWCIESLLSLGYNKEVENTLKYVLEKYSEHNEITVAINSSGRCFNFPNSYSPDSIAYLFRCLRIFKSKTLILKYKKFLNSQISMFEERVLEFDGSLKNSNFSGMRDHTKNTRLCYDMIMCCMLCDEIDRINKLFGKNVVIINNILKKYNLKSKLIAQYWNSKGYFNDSVADTYCSGHSNVYPYFLDVISDKKMLKSSIKHIVQKGLDQPIPLKYGYSKDTKFLWYDIFAHDWEKNTSWTMLGLAYIDIVSRVDRNLAKKYLLQYEEKINKHKCFIELYDKNKPYSSLFFVSDNSMLWASIYLNLKNKLN